MVYSWVTWVRHVINFLPPPVLPLRQGEGCEGCEISQSAKEYDAENYHDQTRYDPSWHIK